MNRRALLTGSMSLLGTAALASLLPLGRERALAMPHFTPRVRRVVYLFMSGGPSQLETFDHKPGLAALDGTELPESIRRGQRLTTMTSGQSSFPVVAPRVGFTQHGENGTWVSDLLPHLGSIVDRLCIVRSMHTDAINHDPAVTLIQSGSMNPGRPCMGSWVSYGLGAPTRDLPTFAVLLSNSGLFGGQPLSTRFWSSAFLPAHHQGVQLRGGSDPVLYLDDGTGAPQASRERLRDARTALDQMHADETGDPDVTARIEAYELAFRMQTSVPTLARAGDEPESTYTLYGDDARIPGTFAANCVLARRLLEDDVRFVQLYHRDWDHHGTMQTDHPIAARAVDRASTALVLDLERRGLLEDTLVIWGGEFGRTVYGQGEVRTDQYGRDHHPRCFSMWLAGGGVRGGLVHGTTDDYSYNVVDGALHVHDFQATVLHLLGFDHTRLTYRSEGRDFRLTDVSGRVANELLDE
ncbi:DUF1501 domain-containing protein [Sandaracinus amylolyticus]|uniref:Sulfatase n=1 Tax=Sandaracinus amylolyticus TaxID=927083 RepID=A0A0F6SHK4_9BACT|nr:DUF1501 domain-containing protein [Sandaracinus amylolyticus]AKF10599.1 Hypothetical protein DB32_007748 [Sandaracinus amylolyticus]